MFLTGISIGILDFGGLPQRRPADAIARAIVTSGMSIASNGRLEKQSASSERRLSR